MEVTPNCTPIALQGFHKVEDPKELARKGALCYANAGSLAAAGCSTNSGVFTSEATTTS